MALKISSVERRSPAARSGLKRGFTITHIDSEPIIDLIDFEYLTAQSTFEIEYTDLKGRAHLATVKKEEYEDFGVLFESDFGKTRSCANKCIFCFVDQLPKGMRESLYFKDDDWRMSFVMGNYVTLTNVSDREFLRILKRKPSPLYISVHATDEKVRGYMLGNIDRANIMDRLKALAENNITFHCQAVIVKDINDKKVLDKTIEELISLYPYARSLALVPVGLTSHREGLEPLSPLDKDAAKGVIDILEKWRKFAFEKYGTHFVFGSDELYIRAGLPLPSFDEYEDFAQIEDGVGLVSSFFTEAETALSEAKSSEYKKISIACGVDIAPYFEDLAKKISSKMGVIVNVYAIENNFLGKSITVSGLITAQDLIKQLKDKDLGDALFISRSMLREKENVFLDDITLHELCGILNIEIYPIQLDGYDFILELTGKNK